jgi:DNA-binding NarL/FixJ family response regulator
MDTMHGPMNVKNRTDHMAQKHQPNPLSKLSRRQQEIAWLLSRTGLSYKEVAARLDISEGTMRKHAENVYRRMGVHSRAELTVALYDGAATLEQIESGAS